MNHALHLVKEMGALRNGLHGTAVVCMLLLPFARGPEHSNSWDLFFSGILPATVPIIVIVIGLDIMMSSIWKSDSADDKERVAHFNRIIRAHLIIGGALLAAWLTVFLPVLV